MPTTDIDALLKERGKTHGDFRDHARYTQAIKSIIRRAQEERALRGQPALSDTMVESLEMDAHKMGRILAGNASSVDHWDDIAGYAKLVANELRGNPEGNPQKADGAV